MIPADPGGASAAGPDSTDLCYLIHFDQRYAHAGHYLGSTHDLDARLAEHRAGRGARLMEVVTGAGIGWHVTRTWPGGRDRERALKDQHQGPRLCPECTPTPRPVKTGRAAEPATPRPAAAETDADTAITAAPGRPRPSRYERGAAMARGFLATQEQAGRTGGQIAATHAYITGPARAAAGRHTPAQAEEFLGYTETVTRHLDHLHDAERDAERDVELEAAG
jgi:predicted GIY-YIG superfamily endonuclease